MDMYAVLFVKLDEKWLKNHEMTQNRDAYIKDAVATRTDRALHLLCGSVSEVYLFSDPRDLRRIRPIPK